VTHLAANTNPDFIVNSDWNQFCTPDDRPPPNIVVVADNPGQFERVNGEYLCRGGRAGGVARRFFDAVSGVCAIEEGWAVVFNKSSFYTPQTAGLVSFMDSPGICPSLLPELREDQNANGRMVAGVAKALSIPVLTVETR
jgi:hypothetical protein